MNVGLTFHDHGRNRRPMSVVTSPVQRSDAAMGRLVHAHPTHNSEQEANDIDVATGARFVQRIAPRTISKDTGVAPPLLDQVRQGGELPSARR